MQWVQMNTLAQWNGTEQVGDGAGWANGHLVREKGATPEERANHLTQQLETQNGNVCEKNKAEMQT